MRFNVRFTNNITLSYSLIEDTIVNEWKTLIEKHDINDCCPNNHYNGYATIEFIQSKIDRLISLADIINLRVPDRIIKQEITLDNWQQPLSVMHVHFPDLKNQEEYKDIWNLLTEYNDIIHWLESILPSYQNSDLFRIFLDFNKSNTTFLDIPDEAYNLFYPYLYFGELFLHYTHVGKNAYELLITKDTVCPSDQFVPQTTFSASVIMNFTNNFHLTIEQQQSFIDDWKRFYDSRGGKDFWNYEFTDPKLALGFMKIGQLDKIYIDDQPYNIPDSLDEINSFRKKLVDSSIIDWVVE